MVQPMLLMQKPKKSAEGLPFHKPLLEKEPAELASAGRADEIHAYIVNQKDKQMPEGLQADLSDRFCSYIHDRSVIKLVVPLLTNVLSAIIIIPTNDAFGFFGTFQLAAIYFASTFVAAIYGNYKSINYERSFSPKITEILDSNGATSDSAQERYSYLVYDAKDSKTATAMLASKKLSSNRAQEILADVVYKYGTKDQAEYLLNSTTLSNLAENMLKLKANSL